MKTIIPTTCKHHNNEWHGVDMCLLSGDICEPCLEYEIDEEIKKEIDINR